MPRAGAPPRPLSDEGEEFLTWLAVERGRAANTLAAYRRDLHDFEDWLSAGAGAGAGPAGGVGAVDAATLDRYQAHLHARGASTASVARAVTTLRGLFRFLVDEGHLAVDPTADLAAPRIAARLPKALSEEETARLVDSVDGLSPLDRRDRALLEVLYGTGVRVSEAVGLSLADLETDTGLVRVLGKGSKERLVPLGRQATAALANWLSPSGRGRLVPARWRSRDDAEAVFLSARGTRLGRQAAWAVLRRRAEAVGLGDRVSPHVLRHSCASHMLARGADIRVVQELLGHASIATTQIYTKLTTEHLRSAYVAAHPRARPGEGR